MSDDPFDYHWTLTFLVRDSQPVHDDLLAIRREVVEREGRLIVSLPERGARKVEIHGSLGLRDAVEPIVESMVANGRVLEGSASLDADHE